MNRTVPLLELHGIEKLREEEPEEARTIQAVMLPAESLRTKLVSISHEFQPVSAVGGVHKTGASPSDTLATFNRRLMIRSMPRPFNMWYSIPVAVNCISPAQACPALFISVPMVAARSASRAFPPGYSKAPAMKH
jgi:hypothetical protein